jgi:hypothetical protein
VEHVVLSGVQVLVAPHDWLQHWSFAVHAPSSEVHAG